MTTWFTSDTHFGHDAIRTLADRPFADLAAMDEAMVTRWNSVVRPGDTVWHLGDFAHRSAKGVPAYRACLHGTIHLIAGNHDHEILKKHRALFASIQSMAEVKVANHTIVMCHYPLREWDKAWRGAWHLHGHVHGRLDDQPHGFSLDVGVDSHDYTPIDAKRIAALFANRTSPFVHAGDRATVSRAQTAARRARGVAPSAEPST